MLEINRAILRDIKDEYSNLLQESVECLQAQTSRNSDNNGKQNAGTHTEIQTKKNGVHLPRQLGTWSGAALIINSMIGAGIFITPKGVVQNSGSVALSLVVWCVGGVVSLLGGLCYAELGTAIPKTGGDYAYLLEAFGSLHRSLGPLPAFLYSWLSTVLLRPSGLAILGMAFAENCNHAVFHGCHTSVIANKCLAGFIICLVTVINCYSIKSVKWVPNFFTTTKLIALAIIIIGGIFKIFQGSTQNLATGFQGSTTNVGGVATAFYSAMAAYDGWSTLNGVTEEIENPSKHLPLCVLLAVPLVTLCYVMTNVAYFSVMSTEELLTSDSVAVTFGNKVLGPLSWSIPIFIACSIFGALHSTAFTSSRFSFAAAREGHQADILSYLHMHYCTPIPSLIFNAIIAILMLIPTDILSLFNFFGFTAWIIYGLVMVSVLSLRVTHKDLQRPYRVHTSIPIFLIFVSLFFVFAPIIGDPRLEYLYATLIIFSGIIIYIPVVYYGKQPSFMGKITVFFQLLLNCVPPSTYD